MGYRIAYRTRKNMRFCNCRSTKLPKKWVVMIGMVLIVAAFLLGWQNGSIRELFLPGDPEVTAAAFQELVHDLRSGDGFREAVTAFCVEVMENAQIIR